MSEERERHTGFFIRLSARSSRQLDRYALRHRLTRGDAARKVVEDALEKWTWNKDRHATASFPRVLDRRRR